MFEVLPSQVKKRLRTKAHPLAGLSERQVQAIRRIRAAGVPFQVIADATPRSEIPIRRAVSVLGLSHVFTANMTGNVVFLGFARAGAPGYAPWVYVAALTAFLVGAVIGGRLGRRFDARRSRWLLSVALIEAGLIFAAALAAWGYQWEPFVASGRAYLLIALMAIAMGLRNATVRRHGVKHEGPARRFGELVLQPEMRMSSIL